MLVCLGCVEGRGRCLQMESDLSIRREVFMFTLGLMRRIRGARNSQRCPAVSEVLPSFKGSGDSPNRSGPRLALPLSLPFTFLSQALLLVNACLCFLFALHHRPPPPPSLCLSVSLSPSLTWEKPVPTCPPTHHHPHLLFFFWASKPPPAAQSRG